MPAPDTVSSRARAAVGSIYQISARLAALLMGLLLMAYLTRRLGVAEYGRYAVAMVTMQFLGITISLATGGATVRLVAGQPQGHRYAATMLQMVTLTASALGLLSAAFAGAIAAALRSPGLDDLLQILSADLAVGAVAGIYSGILVAQGRFSLSAIVLLAGSTGQLGAAVFLVEHGWLASGACVGALCGSVVQLLIGRAMSGIRILTWDRVGFAHLWRHARLLAGAQTALRLSQSMDLLAVKFFTDSAAPAGYYAGANNIGLAGLMLFSPSNSVFLQSMAQSRREGRQHEAARMGEVFVRVALTYGVLLCALSVLAGDICLFLLGPAFAGSASVLAVLLWAVAFRTLAQSGRVLISAVGERASMITPLLMLIVLGAVGYAVFIPIGGILAAAGVALALAVGAALTSLNEGLRLMGIPFPWPTLRRVGVAGVVCALVAHALPGTGSVVLGKLTVACVAYGVVLIALKEWRPDRTQLVRAMMMPVVFLSVGAPE